MGWIKVDDTTYAMEATPDPAVVVNKNELLSEKAFIEARLLELPENPTDNELLAWAKTHYPYHDTGVERAKLTARLDEITSILAL